MTVGTFPATTVGEPVSEARPWLLLLSVLARRPAVIVGGSVLLVMVGLAVFGPSIAPHGANDVDINQMLEPPSTTNWFGTDELGRDVFSRTILGARASLEVSALSVGMALIAGVLLGLVAGYYRGTVDTIVMRVMDVWFSFPTILLAVAIVGILGPGLSSAIIAIAIVYTPYFARVTRGSVLSVRETGYVRASVSIGSSDAYIIRTHVLPNVASPIIVQTSLSLGFAVLAEAALSFLGLGVQPPQPSWGRMLFDAHGFVQEAWWMGVFPGLALVLTVLSFNLIGDSLRDALDPRRRSDLESRRP